MKKIGIIAASTLLLFSTSLFAGEGMKCGAGKCGGTTKPVKKMKNSSKCGNMMHTTSTDIKKEAVASVGNIGKSLIGNAEKGKKIYASCIACHGMKGERKALNVSRKLKEIKGENIAEILREYKNGKRNKYKMGMIMKGQAGRLSDEDIKNVSSYIKTLKN